MQPGGKARFSKVPHTGKDGDREPGRFSRLPANRCALEVRSTTSSTYEFLLRTHRCFAVANRLLVPPFSGRTKEPDRLPGKAIGMPVGGPRGATISNVVISRSFVQKTRFSASCTNPVFRDDLPTVKAILPETCDRPNERLPRRDGRIARQIALNWLLCGVLGFAVSFNTPNGYEMRSRARQLPENSETIRRWPQRCGADRWPRAPVSCLPMLYFL